MVTAESTSPLPCPLSSTPRKSEDEECRDNKEKDEFVAAWRWPDLAGLLFLHIGGLYGIYLLITVGSMASFLYLLCAIYSSGLGITAGVHRLWSHRSYNAAWPLRLLLAFLFTMTGQRDIYMWVLDHRVHHKYSETHYDPHNARRGFWFAHVGWLVLTPRPEVIKARKQVDMSDLEADWVVMVQKKLYLPLFVCVTMGLPVLLPWWLWGQHLWLSFWVNFNLRFAITLNMAFFVNSVAHMWGNRPYDEHISPRENLPVAIAALGEGYHNYHHVFPYDYKTGELGSYPNFTTDFIDTCVKLGLAWGRKSVTPEMIKRRRERTGDLQHGRNVWGWGDKDMSSHDVQQLDPR